MPAKVLVIGLDAFDAALADRWMADGSLPTLARLTSSGTSFHLANSIGTLPDGIWGEITTGKLGATLGWYWYHRQVVAGEARSRELRTGDVDLTAVWDHASRAGRRVAVVDVPKSNPTAELHGVMIREWATHDVMFGTATHPEDLLERLHARYGDRPLPHVHEAASRCDDHDCTPEAFLRMRAALLASIEQKAALVRDLLEEGEWDLLFAVFMESHCVGHQFWHFLDEGSPWHDPAAPEELRNAVRDVYARLDSALARVLEAADSDTLVLVLLSHGMGPMRGGWQLLSEVLVRLGYGSGGALASGIRGRLPEPVKRVLRALMPSGTRHRLREAGGSLPDPLESPSTRAAATSNVPCGAVRLNVRGREPFGTIEPGAEYDAVCDELIRELGALEHARTGTPAVAEVRRADEVFPGGIHPNTPDLLVRFSEEHALIEGVRSPRVGTISRPVRTPKLPRSGDHEPRSRLIACGPGLAAGDAVERGHVVDLTPTVLQLLDVPVPPGLDGRPLELSRARPADGGRRASA